MGLYNFKPRFVEPILRGEKTHTIRAPRKYQDEPGDTMHLYTKLRRKDRELLMRRECVKVEQIVITDHHVLIDAQLLSDDEVEALARRDGFQCFDEMMRFWEGRLPFSGHIYHWKAN